IDMCGRNEVDVKGAGCFQLLQQGPCSVTQMVLLDPYTNKGFCGPRLCPPDRVFIFGDQQCYDPRTPKICPPGRQLFMTAYGTPICGCPDGTYESSDDHYNDVCEPILGTSMLCSQGQVLWFSAPGQRMECLTDPCGGLNLNRGPNDLPYIPDGQGSCPQLVQSTGVCRAETWYSLATDHLLGTCATLQEAGYTVLQPDTLTAIMQQFGNPISTDSTPPIPVAPSATSPTGGNMLSSNIGIGAPINTGIQGNAGVQFNQRHPDVPGKPFSQTKGQNTFTQQGLAAPISHITPVQTTTQQHGFVTSMISSVPSFMSSNVGNNQVAQSSILGNQGGFTFPNTNPHRFTQDLNLGGHRFSSQGSSVLHNNAQIVKGVTQSENLNHNSFGSDGSSQIHTGNPKQSVVNSHSFNTQHNVFPMPPLITFSDETDIPLIDLHQSSNSKPTVGFRELIQLDSEEGFFSPFGTTKHDFEESFGDSSTFDSQSIERTQEDSDSRKGISDGFLRRHQETIQSFSHVSAHTPVYSLLEYLPPKQSNPTSTFHRRHVASLLDIQPGLSLPPNDGLGGASGFLVQKGVKIIAQTNANDGLFDNASIQPSGRSFSDYIESVKLIMSVLPEMQEGKRVQRDLPHNRTRRRALLHASPGNVFEPRLVSCKAGAARDVNAKCRNVILPSRYPPRRSNRAAPPIRPGAQCPQNTVRDARRRCVNRRLATNSLISSGLG
ncbi:unnamed protein product, partial [Meganyctiphanes norvegica]